jgi:hypothetical protein
MLDYLSYALGLPPFTVLSIIIISGLSGFIVSQFLDSFVSQAGVVLGLLAGAIIANVVVKQNDLTFQLDKELDAVVASLFGMVVISLAYIFAKRISLMLSGPKSSKVTRAPDVLDEG